MIFQVQSELLTIQSEIVFRIGEFAFSNTMTSGLLVTLVAIFLSYLVARKYKTEGVPGKFQIVLEMIISMLLGFVDNITGDRKITKQIFPLIGGLFFYLLISNTMLMIPGISSFTYNDVAIFRSHTTDFNATFGVAVAMIIFTHILSIKKNNVFGHLNKFIRIGTVVSAFRRSPAEGLMSLVDFFVGFLDIIGELAKSLSLSLRLFGNIFAGEMLGSVIMGLFALFLPIPLMILGLFSGVIQAVVFGALTSSYFAIALKDE